MEHHLRNKNKAAMTKSKTRTIGKARTKRNGIIIVQRINFKTLLRIGRDCQVMVICRHLSEIARYVSEKMNGNKDSTYTLCDGL